MDNSAKYIIGTAAIFIVGMIAFGYFSNNPNIKNTAAVINSDDLPGIQVGTTTPWQAEVDNLKARLDLIDLPALNEEGFAVHTHQHLDIFIDGEPVAVPAEIGISHSQNFISPIHTHDETAVIHIESPTVQSFYLGQFFDIWGVRFNENCIGGYCSTSEKTLRVYVDGKLVDGNPRNIELLQHQEIVVTYGTSEETPNPIPSLYIFGEGL